MWLIRTCGDNGYGGTATSSLPLTPRPGPLSLTPFSSGVLPGACDVSVGGLGEVQSNQFSSLPDGSDSLQRHRLAYDLALQPCFYFGSSSCRNRSPGKQIRSLKEEEEEEAAAAAAALACVAQWIEHQPENQTERLPVHKGSPVRFPVRAHAWVVGQVPGWGRARGNHTLMFLSLSPALPSPLSENK